LVLASPSPCTKHHHSWLGNIRLVVGVTNLLEQEANPLLPAETKH